MNKPKLVDISIVAVGIAAIALIAYFTVDRIIPVFSPFLIAWAVATMVRSPAAKLSKKTRVPERILRVFLAVLITLISFGMVAILIWQLLSAIWRFLSDIGEGGAVFDLFDKLSNPDFPFFVDKIPKELTARLSEAVDTMISEALSRLASLLTSLVSTLPNALLFLVVTVISLIYFCIDLERINSFITGVLSTKVNKMLQNAREKFFKVALGYAKSYFLILLITFGEVFLGLVLIRVEHAALLALFISLLDILPIIGVGTVLLPWSIFSFIFGSHMRGIGLLILFAVVAVVRQFIEPRIVGKNLNLHPVVTIVFIYVGYAFFGILGIIILPIAALIVGALIKEKHSAEIDESRA